MKRLFLLLLVLIVIGFATAWWYSPARVVERRTESLLEILTIQPNGGVASRQAVVYGLGALLAQDVELSCPDVSEANGTFPSSEIEAMFAWIAENTQGTRFQREKIHSVTVTGDLATVDITLNALVSLSQGNPLNGRYRATLLWRNGETGWLLSSATGKLESAGKSAN